MILPEMIGHTFDVHNGKRFISVFVSDNMVGHRFGEFAPTRVFKGHGSKKVQIVLNLQLQEEVKKIYATSLCENKVCAN